MHPRYRVHKSRNHAVGSLRFSLGLRPTGSIFGGLFEKAGPRLWQGRFASVWYSITFKSTEWPCELQNPAKMEP